MDSKLRTLRTLARRRPRWALAGLVPCLLASAGTADAAAPRVDVRSAQELLGDSVGTAAKEAAIDFESEHGHRLHLQLAPDPSAILNPHYRGELHPVDAARVREVFERLGELPGRALDVRVYCLPGLPDEVRSSHCVGGEIFLVPGFAPIPEETLAYTVVHELGHVLQHVRAARGGDAWSTYLRLRGLDRAPYADDAPLHRDRPAEIFAEDFRVLFGGDEAEGAHENSALEDPRAVAGLRSYFDGLLEGAYASGRAIARFGNHPNPFNPRTTVTVELRPETVVLGGTAQLEIYDLRGRRIRRYAPVVVAEVLRFDWDGTDESGLAVASGRYAYRVRMRDRDLVGAMTLLK